MKQDENRQQQLIHDAITRSTESVQDVAVQLWHSLALQLVSIIGEGGFNSLYARSLYLAHKSYPWFPPDDASRQIDFQFTDLKLSLATQSPVDADKASRMLLQTFANLLTSLVGGPLTITILSSAWANRISEQETASKELRHE